MQMRLDIKSKGVWLLILSLAFLLPCVGCGSSSLDYSGTGTGTYFDLGETYKDSVFESSDYEESSLNSTEIYEDSVLLGSESRSSLMDGFRISDVNISHQGTHLPEGVSTDALHQGGRIQELIDQDGALPINYEYVFVTYHLTNEANAEGWFMLNSAKLYVLGNEYEVLGESGDVCYLNGKDQKANEIVKDKQIAREALGLGESKTYTVAFLMESDIISKGILYFVPDNSAGMMPGDPLLHYQGIKL
jgi:hypothetical protein